MITTNCNECPHVGNLKACEAAPCSKHESWYALALKKEISDLQKTKEVLFETQAKLAKNYYPEGK